MIKLEDPFASLHFPVRKEDINNCFTELHKRMYSKAYSIVGNHDDAEDLASAAFLRILNSIDSCHADSTPVFLAWVSRTVMNICFNHLRDARKRPENNITEEWWETLPAPETPERPLLEMAREVRRYIEASDDINYSIIRFRFLGQEERSVEETSRELSIPEGTVKSRTSRGFTKIRRHFET